MTANSVWPAIVLGEGLPQVSWDLEGTEVTQRLFVNKRGQMSISTQFHGDHARRV
jgi:hypothetical protein